MADLTTIIIVITLAALPILTMLINKKLHYFTSGLTLITIGVLPILHNAGIMEFDLGQFPILNFVVYFLVVLAGKDLLKEGFKEKSSSMKIPSIVLGAFLIIMNTIPTLNTFEVIEWTLPAYPPIIDHIIYIVSGIFLIIGIFTILATKE